MLTSMVYDSGYGHTAKLAQFVADGARSVADSEVRLISVHDGNVPWDVLEQSDAIIFGSPTYNGNVSARLKKFFEESTQTAWLNLKWRNKIAAGFTNSGAMHGDKLNSLMAMALFAAQHGMIWVGLDLMPGKANSKSAAEDLNRLGSWLGAMAQSDDASAEVAPPGGDLKTASYLGQRVAEVTQRWIGTDAKAARLRLPKSERVRDLASFTA